MSMLRVCSEPGCTTLTLGRLCIDHEPVLSRVRGEVVELPLDERELEAATDDHVGAPSGAAA